MSAEIRNDDIYREVMASGFGSLQCLGAEVYGLRGPQNIKLAPALAEERTRGLHPRVRMGDGMRPPAPLGMS